MSAVTTRRYEQRARAESAERTRRRIVAAVLERLRRAPAEPVSIERIAAMANVARSTVYAIFGSRAGLFDAVGEAVFERSGYALVVDAARHPDAREHLRSGLRAASEMFAADRAVLRALYSMAQLDEQAVGGAIGRWEAERAAGMKRLARRLGEEGELRPGVAVEHAEHVLWVLTSFESFDLLFTGRGLAPQAAAALLISTAEGALCAEEGA
jgi:AcrR family transcriptional regulator